MQAPRRKVLLAAALGTLGPCSHAQPGPADDRVEVWLDLAEAPLSSLRDGPDSARAALADRIRRQQDSVAAQVFNLGGRELARVSLLRNALAVSLPARQLDAARKLPGVVSIRPALPIRRDERHLGAT